MSVDHDKPPALSTAAESDIVGYSAISPAAIVALLLGLASFLAIGNLLLLLLPALAMLAGAYSLAQIARSEGSLTGRWAAVAGLGLAALFASAAVARSATRALHLRHEARALADEWLQLVRSGRLEQAHQWHLPADERQLPGTSLAQFYQDSKPAGEQLQQFMQAAPLSEVVRAASDAQLRFVRVVEQVHTEESDRVALFYELSAANGKPVALVIVTERIAREKQAGGDWHVAAVVAPKNDDATP